MRGNQSTHLNPTQSHYFHQVGYVDVEGRSFGFGSGPRTPKIFPSAHKLPSGNVTADDTFLIGSGTKSFTATAGLYFILEPFGHCMRPTVNNLIISRVRETLTRSSQPFRCLITLACFAPHQKYSAIYQPALTPVMRLVDQGLVKMEDPASKHLDPSLTRGMGKTFVELFGSKAAKVQVKHLLQMQSGIADFDIPSLDNQILVSAHPITGPHHTRKCTPHHLTIPYS